MTPLDEAAALHDPMPSLFVPADAEPGLTEHRLAQDIHALICLKGFDEARSVIAEILNYEAERKPRRAT